VVLKYDFKPSSEIQTYWPTRHGYSAIEEESCGQNLRHVRLNTCADTRLAVRALTSGSALIPNQNLLYND